MGGGTGTGSMQHEDSSATQELQNMRLYSIGEQGKPAREGLLYVTDNENFLFGDQEYQLVLVSGSAFIHTDQRIPQNAHVTPMYAPRHRSEENYKVMGGRGHVLLSLEIPAQEFVRELDVQNEETEQLAKRKLEIYDQFQDQIEEVEQRKQEITRLAIHPLEAEIALLKERAGQEAEGVGRPTFKDISYRLFDAFVQRHPGSMHGRRITGWETE